MLKLIYFLWFYCQLLTHICFPRWSSESAECCYWDENNGLLWFERSWCKRNDNSNIEGREIVWGWTNGPKFVANFISCTFPCKPCSKLNFICISMFQYIGIIIDWRNSPSSIPPSMIPFHEDKVSNDLVVLCYSFSFFGP